MPGSPTQPIREALMLRMICLVFSSTHSKSEH